MADDKSVPETEKKEASSSADTNTDTEVKKDKKKGILSRIWNGLFQSRGDDFEKRLQYISKEEVTVLGRMKRRAVRWRHTCRNLIVLSVVIEVIAVGYAIMTTRSVDLDWKMRAFRVLPMFLLPALSSAAYYGLANFNKFCDRKDQKTLELLRAERQAKIDELKEKTNYYITQQLIQRYDTDPAAKAAAATVLASKLGADSGIKVSVGDEPTVNAATGKSNDVEYVQSTGLRNRKQVNNRSNGAGTMQMHGVNEQTPNFEVTEGFGSEHEQIVDHYHPEGPATHEGGWLARLAALLVGEDPTQCYALICGNCHMHNGLARKEDFPFITYYCPHCHALNGPKQLEERLGSENPNASFKAGNNTSNATLRAGSSAPDASLIAGSSVPDASLKEGSSTPDASLKAGSSTPDASLNAGSSIPDSSLKAGSSIEMVDNRSTPGSDSEPTSSTQTEAKPKIEEGSDGGIKEFS